MSTRTVRDVTRVSLVCLTMLGVLGLRASADTLNFSRVWSTEVLGLAVGDAANSGSAQIIVGIWTPLRGYIAAMDSSWNVTWSDTLPADMAYCSAIAIGDADNDTHNEMVAYVSAGHSGPGSLRIYKYSGGAYLLNGELSLSTWVQDQALAIGDPDNDGQNEIIVGQDWYARQIQVYGYSNGNFNLEWQDQIGSDVRSVDVGDCDNDNVRELLVGTGDWSAWDMRVYKAGSAVWSCTSPAPNSEFCGVAIGDVNNDQQNEIAGAWYGSSGGPGAPDSGGVVVYRWDGSTYAQMWRRDFSGKTCTNVTIGDANDDGSNEVLCLTGPSYFAGDPRRNISEWGIKVYRDSSLLVERTIDVDYCHFASGSNRPTSLCCVDIDRGGAAEVVVSDVRKVLVLKVSSTGIQEFEPGPGRTLLKGHPSHFQRSTLIEIDIPRAAMVSLRVYDLTGTPVRTLVDGVMAAGRRSIEWDGSDDGGQSVASGKYVYRLNACGQVKAGSVVLSR